MDGNALRYWLKALGAVPAFALLLSVLSFDLQDPTLTNLRLPSGGVANWLALPGALIGGSLLELLGSAVLALPLLWCNWLLCTRARPAADRYAFWCGCLLIALSGLHGLALPPRTPGLLDAGLAGWAAAHWAALTTGPWLAAALLAYIAAMAAAHILYAPLLHAAVRDARVFAVWLLRESWRSWRSGTLAVQARAQRMHRVAGATALGLGQRARLGVVDGAGALLSLPAVALHALRAWRHPSLARIKTRSMGRAASAGRRPSVDDAAVMEADGFEGWFQPVPPSGEAAAETARQVRTGTPALGRLGSREAVRAALSGEDDAPPGASDAQPVLPRPALATPMEKSLAPNPAPPATKPGTANATAHEMAPHGEEADSEEADGVRADPVAGDYAFERTEAEAAWRERFQRYARNLDLDWEEQLWRRREDDARDDNDVAHDGDG